jgi:hypothetical protein
MTTIRTGYVCRDHHWQPVNHRGKGCTLCPTPHGCKRDELGRSDVIFSTHVGALGAPVEGGEVSRPVSRAAALVFLAPALCSAGRHLTGNHTSPLIVEIGVA